MFSLEDRDIPDRSDPHADLAAVETEERLRAGLGRPPGLQREVFLLRANEGVTTSRSPRPSAPPPAPRAYTTTMP